MKKTLLVTLADSNFILQAKQLFSSAYFNSGWQGDYMLLSHEIPEKELKWFRDKGILIKKCKPLYNKKVGKVQLPPTILSKFYLFTPEFKKWDNIVYLDADIIVRASLEELTKVKNFAAVQDVIRLIFQFIKPKKADKRFNELKRNYNLEEFSFNSGVMAFSTDIIHKNTFFRLKKLFEDYRAIHMGGDQPTLNLFFYKKWVELPLIYNTSPHDMMYFYNTKPEKIKGVLLHFTSKPKIPKSPFYNEWKYNLDKAELINLKKPLLARKKWTKQEIRRYCLYLKINYLIQLSMRTIRNTVKPILLTTDRHIGLFGLFLKKHFPKFYYFIKKYKK